jgi:hypothetical protein
MSREQIAFRPFKSCSNFLTRLNLLALFFFGVVVGLSPAANYHVVAHYKVQGAGRIDALAIDIAGRRLYLAHGNSVAVLDADSGTRVGTIEGTPGITGIALAPEFHRGFVANGTGDSITIFDTATLKTVDTVKSTGRDPAAITYDEGTKRVFVSNGATGNLTVLDAASGKVDGTVDLGDKPGQLVSNGYGDLFVLAAGSNRIHVVDTSTLHPLGDFPTGTGENCSGLTLDPVGRRLFVACQNGDLPIIDTDIGFTFQELAIGSGLAGDAFAFSPTGEGGWKGAIFVVTSDGTLSILQMNAFIRYSPGVKLMLRPGIHAVAFDSKTHRIFVPEPAPSGGAWEVAAISQ